MINSRESERTGQTSIIVYINHTAGRGPPRDLITGQFVSPGRLALVRGIQCLLAREIFAFPLLTTRHQIPPLWLDQDLCERVSSCLL